MVSSQKIGENEKNKSLPGFHAAESVKERPLKKSPTFIGKN
jgi:hypothetical protein